MHWNQGCRITVGKVSCINRPDYITDKDALHEEIEIKYFYEGTATLLIGTKTVSVKAGDVVVINPFEFHATVNTGENKGKYHLFMIPLDYFSGIGEANFLEQFFLEEKRFRTHYRENAELCVFLQKAADEVLLQQPGCALMIKSLLLGFFASVLRYGVDDKGKSVPEKNLVRLYSVIKPALHCIKNEYSRSITIDEMAILCKVSKHYFCRVFKEVTGKSPMEYLQDFRLRVADVLLSGTDKPVAEIALLCGFEYPNYFSRCYKKHYGKSPSSSRPK